jgi:2-polyprenyl-3-methyl-5-hydroxy-6-metoxy-1,4-benzoquinol methylase
LSLPVKARVSPDNRVANAELPETLYGLNKRLLFIREALEALNDPSVLDIGCGTGEFLTLPLARQGWRITGLDIHSASIDRASKLASGLPRANFICGTLDDVRERFGAILLSEVIEHVTNPRKLLEDIRQKLVGDGVLVLTLPNGYGPFEIEQFLSKRNFLWIRSLHALYVRRTRKEDKAAATYNEESQHINFFSWTAVHELIHASGFEVVAFRARTFIAGDYSSALLRLFGLARIPVGWLIKLNATIADSLPPRLTSGWMFVCRVR